MCLPTATDHKSVPDSLRSADRLLAFGVDFGVFFVSLGGSLVFTGISSTSSMTIVSAADPLVGDSALLAFCTVASFFLASLFIASSTNTDVSISAKLVSKSSSKCDSKSDFFWGFGRSMRTTLPSPKAVEMSTALPRLSAAEAALASSLVVFFFSFFRLGFGEFFVDAVVVFSSSSSLDILARRFFAGAFVLCAVATVVPFAVFGLTVKKLRMS